MTHDTTAYKASLEELLATLTEDLKEIGIHDPKNPANWIESGTDLNDPSADPNEVADRAEELGERRATVAVLETRYNNIVSALERIGNGTFGVCEVCNAQIEEDRLQANPAARTCTADMDKGSAS